MIAHIEDMTTEEEIVRGIAGLNFVSFYAPEHPDSDGCGAIYYLRKKGVLKRVTLSEFTKQSGMMREKSHLEQLQIENNRLKTALEKALQIIEKR